MPITDYQREQRQRSIGASDVAAILGVDPFRDQYTVWLEKTGQLDAAPSSPLMELGNALEASVLDMASQSLGPIRRNQRRVFDGDVPLASNCDALVVETGEPINAKTSGLMGPLPAGWGEPETDQVPDHIIVQIHAEMMCTGAELAHVAALLGGRGFCMYHIRRSQSLSSLIAEKCRAFWSLVEAKQAPAMIAPPPLEVLRRVRREPSKVVPVDPALVVAWRDAVAAKKQAEEKAEQAQAMLIATMGDAEGGTAGDIGDITFMEQTRKGYTVQPSTYRVLRLKARKGS